MVMNSLANILATSAPPGAMEVSMAIREEPLENLDLSYDFLGSLLGEIDPVVGETFKSQVIMARRLVCHGDLQKLVAAKRSLEHLVLGVKGKKWPSDISHVRPSEVTKRGSFWRLMEDWKESQIPSVDLEGRSAEIINATAGLQNNAIALAQGGRPTQQDRALAFNGVLPNGITISLSIVADGCFMLGDIASETAVQSFTQKLFEELLFNFHHSAVEVILIALRFAEQQVAANANRLGGTMFVAYVQVGEEKYIVNVGDSQAWFLSDAGEYTKVTIDHRMWEFDCYAPIRRLGWRLPPEEEGVVSLAEPDIFIPTQELSGHLFLFSDGVFGEIGEMVAKTFPKKPLDLWAKDIIQVMSGLFVDPARLDNMTVNIRRIK